MGALIEKATGYPIDVPDAHVADYLATGKYVPAGDTPVQLGESGPTVSLGTGEAAAALGGDTNLRTPDAAALAATARDAQLEQDYGDGFANNALAGLAGAARGASFGLSDLIAAGVLDDDQMFGLEQLRLRNSVISTASEIGGALIPTLLTGGSGAVGTGARLTAAGRAAMLGEGIAARIGGEGITRAALRGAISAGTEGALFGAGQTITSAALHDDPFTLDALASNISLGAVLGGATGGLLGAVGATARRVVSATTPVDEMAMGLTRVLGKGDDIVAAAKAARTATGVLDDGAEKAFLQARRGLTKDLTEEVDLGRVFTVDEKRVRRVIDNVDKLSKAAHVLDNQTGQTFGVALEMGEQAVAQRMANAGLDGGMAQIADGDLAAALGKSADAKTEAWIAQLDPTAKETLKAWAVAQTQGAEQAAARGGVAKRLMKSIAVGAGRQAIPGGVRGSGIISGVVRGGFRQLGGAAAGAAFGYIADGMAGAGAGMAAGAAIGRMSGLASKAIRALAKPTTARAITAAGVLGATRFGQESDKDVSRARMKEIAAAATNRGPTNRAIQVATLPVAIQNPAVGAKLGAALQARLDYIFNKSPWRPGEKALRMSRGEPVPSRYEVAKWARSVRAAEDPMTLLEDLGNRQITPEAVEAVKTLYPEMFAKMQLAVMEQVGSVKKGLPYQSRLQLSVFFDVPLDASQTAEFGAAITEMYAPKQGPAPQPRGSLGTPGPQAGMTTAQKASL